MNFLGKIGTTFVVLLSSLGGIVNGSFPNQSGAVTTTLSTTTITTDVSVTSTVTFSRDLYYGLLHDADVVSLQDFLAMQGVFDGSSNGNYLSFTKQAVKAFQIQEGLTPATGFFGSTTRARANELAAQDVTFVAPNTPTPSAVAIETATTSTQDTLTNTVTDLASTTDALTHEVDTLTEQYKDLEQQVTSLASNVTDLQNAATSALQGDQTSSDTTSTTMQDLSSPPSVTNTSASHIYVLGDLSLTYPQDWDVVSTAPSGARAAFGPIGDSTVTLAVFKSSTQATQADFVTEYKKQIVQKNPGWQDQPGASLITIAIENPTTQQHFVIPSVFGVPYTSGTEQGGQMIVIFVYKGSAYILQVSSPASKWQNYMPTIMNIFNTSKLKG